MDIQNTMMIFQTLLIILAAIISPRSAQKEQDKSCTTNCGNHIKIIGDNREIKIYNPREIKIVKRTYQDTIQLFILQRRRYLQMINLDFGIKPYIISDKTLHPSGTEPLEWIEKMMCKIGPICPAIGENNCWGSGLTICNSVETNTWVKKRVMKFHGMITTKSFRDSCVLDWSCSIDQYQRKLLTNDDGRVYINVNDEPIFIEDEFPLTLEKEYGTIFIKEAPKYSTKEVTITCFEENNKMFCFEKNKDSAIYFIRESTQEIVPFGSSMYIFTQKPNYFTMGSTNTALLKDIKEITDAIETIGMILNKNSFSIYKEIISLKRTLSAMIPYLLDSSPHLMSAFIDKPTISRHLVKNIIEVCYCSKSLDSCMSKEFHNPHISFCPKKNITEYDPFKSDFNITEILDEDFEFKGSEINPVLSIIEKQLNEDIEEKISEPETNESLYEAFNPYYFYDMILKYSGLISLLIILVNRVFK